MIGTGQAGPSRTGRLADAGMKVAVIERGRFGSRVSVVEMAPRLIPREDEDVSKAVREILEAEGVSIRTGAD